MRIKKETKKILLTAGVIVLVLVAGWIFLRFVIGGGEDDWIKDSRGVYIKHGNPSETPAVVAWQKAIIACSLDLFNNFTAEKNSQCLGTCLTYAVDIVHVPRTAEDDLTENQCAEYGKGIISHFIELDKNGEIVRII